MTSDPSPSSTIDRGQAHRTSNSSRSSPAAARPAYTCVLTASRRGVLPAALATHFGQRSCCGCPPRGHALARARLEDRARGAPAHRVGVHPGQQGISRRRATDGDTVAPLEQAANAIRREGPSPVMQIEVLPTHVPRASLSPGDDLKAVPLGISDEHLGPADGGPVRTSFLGRRTLPQRAQHGIGNPRTRCAPSRSSGSSSPPRSLAQPAARAGSLERHGHQRGRMRRAGGLVLGASGGGESSTRLRRCSSIDDGGELADAMSVTRLERLVRLARDSPLRVVASVETGSARGIGIAWIRELRREGHGLLLQPDLAADGDLLAARLPGESSVPLTPGRGFLVVRGSAELIHIASLVPTVGW